MTTLRTLAKLNHDALWQMNGPRRRLDAEFPNKKHLNRKERIYSLDDLRAVFVRKGGATGGRELLKTLLPSVRGGPST